MCPHHYGVSMKIRNMIQRSNDWHIYRMQGIGSSDIAAIMGLSSFKTAEDVFEEKMGFSLDKTSPAMERGIRYEREALIKAEDLLGVDLVPLIVEDDREEFIRASLDGYNRQKNILVEIKIPLPENYFKNCQEIAQSYYCQVQWQMMITGSEQAFLFIYSPEIKEGIMHVCEAAPIYQAKLKETARRFWKEHIIPGIKPETKKYMPEIHDLSAIEAVEEYVAICESIKRQEARKNELKMFIESFGEGESFKCGKAIVDKVCSPSTLDRKKMIEDGINLGSYEVKGKDHYRIRIVKYS